jgi:hypothetical protein
VPRSQQNHVSLAAVDQRHSAQNEGAHENLTQLCVSCYQGPQLGAAHLQKFAGSRDPASHKAATAGDHGDFSGESSSLVIYDQALTMHVGLNDFHAPGEQHEACDVEIAGLKKDLADFYISDLAQGSDTIDLFGSQNWKGLTTHISRQRS